MEFRLGLMVEPVRFAAELDGDVGGERIRNRKEERERETERYFGFWLELVEGQRSCLLKWGKLES